MPNPKEISILSKWLEQRLKEHFVKRWRGQKSLFKREDDVDWLFSASPNQSNGIPIETAIFDFRILDLSLEHEPELPTANNLFEDENDDQPLQEENDDGEDELAGLPSSLRNKPEPYKQRNSHVYLIYQEGFQSVGKELRLFMQATQFQYTNPPFGDTSQRQKYILSLDEHEIDVYTQVFTILKNWVLFKTGSSGFALPVPECYYGSYETEEKVPPSSTKNKQDDIELDVDDDILSKVAAGMRLFERDKKRKEQMHQRSVPVTQSGCRLLILQDIFEDDFKTRNLPDSTFLSLINVEAAVKSLAMVHSVSWAFSKRTGSALGKQWKLLDNHPYLSYICDRVIHGYPMMVGLVREFLTKRVEEKLEDETNANKIVQKLMKLKTRIVEIVEGHRTPHNIECLIHQDANSSNFLFRYVVLNKHKVVKGKGKRDPKPEPNNNNSQAEDSMKPSTSGIPPEYAETKLKREVMIINWRTASYGSPMIDVAFLLMTALPPKTRREETQSLLRTYWYTFQMYADRLGINFNYSSKELYGDYLVAMLYTCVLITGNIQRKEGFKVNDDGIEVFVEAVKDLIDAGLI